MTTIACMVSHRSDNAVGASSCTAVFHDPCIKFCGSSASTSVASAYTVETGDSLTKRLGAVSLSEQATDVDNDLQVVFLDLVSRDDRHVPTLLRRHRANDSLSNYQ
jgi:hypothetical protein